MRLAVFEAMALNLWRDRAAFALTFLLPPAIFAVFAIVFSSAAGGDLTIRLGAVSPEGDEVSATVIAGLETSEFVDVLVRYPDRQAMETQIIAGAVDAGIEITRPAPDAPPAFQILFDQAKESAATIAEAALADQAPPEFASENVVAPAKKTPVSGAQDGAAMAAYYAAGVGMLFLFLSGFQSALTVIEERDAGVMERIAAGPYGVRPMIDGKFAFLTAQGLAQLVVIFVVAALVFGVNVSQSPILLMITMIIVAICAAGLCLAIVGFCRTRSQAHAIGAVLALVMGALGGSMAPRFLMAPEIRALGAFMPNAWGIEAFSASLWRGGDLALLWGPWALLLGTGLAGLGVSYVAMQKSMRAV